ncbi:GntR family transcriptional regulator [Coraliomargarita parva]|uniref:GntR family transcriptional regulator n=1 Tax=Coraliomargarita parva TaxID=3014050 RepID=UPI0022B3D232|nr:GntR family transcriptional regulator [Coraliomargarita parva]
MIEQFEEIKLERGEVAHRVITEHIRNKILTGEIAPGTEFPSTAQLAERWNTSNSTAHIALKNLVKEGLLERRHGSGTFVRERPRALKTMGIYFGNPNIWSKGQYGFYRSLQGLLEQEITRRGYAVEVYVDRREQRNQREALPSLAEAITKDEIQGLVIPMANSVNLPALLKLPVATSVITGAKDVSNKVNLNDRKFFPKPVAHLKKKGCQTIALITSVQQKHEAGSLPTATEYFKEDFLKEVETNGMQTKTNWIKQPVNATHNQTKFGYKAAKELFESGDIPDAIICYPDMTTRGLITAALELGIHKSHKIQYVLHQSLGVEMYCPFKATWLQTDTVKTAHALIDLVEAQYQGKKVTPIGVPFRFKTYASLMEDSLGEH